MTRGITRIVPKAVVQGVGTLKRQIRTTLTATEHAVVAPTAQLTKFLTLTATEVAQRALTAIKNVSGGAITLSVVATGLANITRRITKKLTAASTGQTLVSNVLQQDIPAIQSESAGMVGRATITTEHVMPSAAWQALAERVGGTRCYSLFELTVTHPTPKTWYLAVADVTFPDGTAYWGLIRTHTGVSAMGALGGVVSSGGVTMTIDNAIGTGGPGLRFMDLFAANVPGYGEPYDLLTATLRVRLGWIDRPNELLPIGVALAIQPDGLEWAHGEDGDEVVRLSFGPDERRYRGLPRTTVTRRRYPHAPDTSLNQPMVPWFGTLRVPCLPLDADGGLYGIGASPTATPLSSVSRLWTLRQDPGSDNTGQVALPVAITTAGQAVLTIAGNANPVDLTQVAQRFELETNGAFLYAIRLWLRRKSAGVAGVGSISLAIKLDADGLPGSATVDRGATAEINAAIVTTGTFAPYDIPLQSNLVGRAAYVPPGRGLWLIVKYAKGPAGGDLEIEIDTTGAYVKGILATQTTGTDNEWILTGKQQRRGPVRLDYTGIGQLGRNVATGAIVTRPPVTVPGL
jgi:hypothetical protein